MEEISDKNIDILSIVRQYLKMDYKGYAVFCKTRQSKVDNRISNYNAFRKEICFLEVKSNCERLLSMPSIVNYYVLKNSIQINSKTNIRKFHRQGNYMLSLLKNT